MTPSERAAAALRLFEINKTMRDLQEHIQSAGAFANAVGATGLALATYHLSDSIAAYITELNRYMAKELDDAR